MPISPTTSLPHTPLPKKKVYHTFEGETLTHQTIKVEIILEPNKKLIFDKPYNFEAILK